MCITPADVTEVQCLFYQKVLSIVSSQQYGIECNEQELLTELKKVFNHWQFKCYSDDYIRNLVLDSTITYCTTRDTQEASIIFNRLLTEGGDPILTEDSNNIII